MPVGGKGCRTVQGMWPFLTHFPGGLFLEHSIYGVELGTKAGLTPGLASWRETSLADMVAEGSFQHQSLFGGDPPHTVRAGAPSTRSCPDRGLDLGSSSLFSLPCLVTLSLI